MLYISESFHTIYVGQHIDVQEKSLEQQQEFTESKTYLESKTERPTCLQRDAKCQAAWPQRHSSNKHNVHMKTAASGSQPA
jgi:hypothetical protein